MAAKYVLINSERKALEVGEDYDHILQRARELAKQAPGTKIFLYALVWEGETPIVAVAERFHPQR